MLEAIGKELKVARIRQNLTLENVAEQLNINRETLRRYENNATGLSVERLEEILNFYNMDKNIFFTNVCEYMHK
jgi:transcriptional regulator with XRE-family HTH domain